MKRTIIASLIGLTFAPTIFATENIELDDITVKSNRFEHKDTETTYASEIHTAKQIEASGAATLYDYLSQQSSLNVVSNYSNKATPAINLRGYGSENGYQNVVISVDGQRLNNIDMQPALLAAIPLSNIERIEISKGSGSVIYGDGATAGTIQIYTKNKTGVTVSTSFGNYGQENHYINAGIAEQYFDLSANAAHDSYDGFSDKDSSGNKDKFRGDTQNIKLKIKPANDLRFYLEATSSRNDIRYVNALTLAQFQQNPQQAGSGNYTHQSFNTDQWRLGGEYDINENIQARVFHYQEHKFSEFISATPSKGDSDYTSNDISLSYQDSNLSTLIGYQNFNGERFSVSAFSPTNTTTKKNKAFFAQSEYKVGDFTLSLGARREQVKYNFAPLSAASEQSSNNINSWDAGVNYKLSPEISTFANYNLAHQAPDIDRLFNFSGGFNGFIAPAKAQTINIGLNHVVSNNRFKLTSFYSKLNNEIYLNPVTFVNTNIDESHKYGIEVQDFFKISSALNTSIIYNYTRSIIDSEGGGSFNDKDLPGVPKHSLVANLNYQFLEHATLNLNQTWRSKAFAYNDFANTFSQKQADYLSTNLALSYQYKNLQLFTSINNIFEHRNYIQVSEVTSSGIYPVDFVRTWRIGMKADF